MPVILLYLVKLSVSLLTVFLFYKLVLRRLTFYNWNRFYLLAYTALSFLIPFINITPVLQRNEMMSNKVVRFIPQVGDMHEAVADKIPVDVYHSVSWSFADWVLYIAIAGAVIMLIRLLVQLISFKKIISKAQLVSDNGVKLYQVNRSIIPFSFGNAIFINQQLHNDEELKEIIRHEFIHVRQKHTLDVIWAELLCILNWYNPFAWFIRKAIRQNLEFIADNKVLQTGFDKKQYQYLLLKVIGNNHFSIASQFNFSSLKKRIAMMNKMKSARVHLVKFLFVLPLAAVLILSFRGRVYNDKKEDLNKIFKLSGIVYDNKTELPLQGVIMVDPASGIDAVTDANGFYSFEIPVTNNNKQRILIKCSKPGYFDYNRNMEIEFNPDSQLSTIGFFSLLSKRHDGEEIKPAIFYSARDKKGNSVLNPDYELVNQKFVAYINKTEEPGIYEDLKIISFQDLKLQEKAFCEIKKSFASITLSRGDHMDQEHKSFFQSNKGLKLLYWKNGLNTLEIYLEDEVREEYDLTDKESIKKAEVKYGNLPEPFAGGYDPFNSKGYDVQIIDVSGNCTIIIKDKTRKEIKRLLLTEWNRKKEYYENLYGDMLIYPKNVILPAEQKNHSALGTLEDTIPVTRYKKLTIDDKNIATVILTNGKTEVYNLNNETEKMKFSSKFGMNANDEIVEVHGFTGEKSVVSGTTVQTTATENVSLSGTFTAKPVNVTAVTIGTTSTKVSPAKATVSGVTVNSTFSDEPVKEVFSAEPVKEVRPIDGKILTEIKSDMQETQLRKIEKDLKSRGYEFDIRKTEYSDGKLIFISGVIQKKDAGQFFSASDFSKLVITEASAKDGSQISLLVEKGKLSILKGMSQ